MDFIAHVLSLVYWKGSASESLRELPQYWDIVVQVFLMLSGDIYKITSCFHITWFNWMPWIFPGEASFRWACVGRLVVEVRIAPEPLGYMAVRVRPLWWQGPQHGGSPDPLLLWVAVLVGIRSLALVTSMWENTLLMSNELFYKKAICL